MDLSSQIQAILSKSGNYIHGLVSDDGECQYSSITGWKRHALIAGGMNDTMETSTSDYLSTPRNTEPMINHDSLIRQYWYKTGYDYYEDDLKCPANLDGVLGGFACLSERDLVGSREFLLHLQSKIRPQLKLTKKENGEMNTYAVECGAGIGRVSKGLLLPLGVSRCDLVEPSPRLLSSAPDYLGEEYSPRCRFLCTGLQDFEPKAKAYDVIWVQWVIGYLTDDDLVLFLKRCAVALREGGVIIIKDNTCPDMAFVLDKDDASVTRSLPYILAIVELANLRVVYEKHQEDFPPNIFPVPMLALEPRIDLES